MTVPTTLTGTHDGCGGSVVFRPVTQRGEALAGNTVTLRAACRTCGATLSIQWSMANAGIQSEALPMAAGGETVWQPQASTVEYAPLAHEHAADDGGTVTEMAGWMNTHDRAPEDETRYAAPAVHQAPATSSDSERDAFLQQFANRFEAARQAVRQVCEDLPNVGSTALPATPPTALPAREPFVAPAATAAPAFAQAEPATALPVIEPAGSFRMPQLRATTEAAPAIAPEQSVMVEPVMVEPVMVEPDVVVPTLPAPADVLTVPAADVDAPPSPASVQDAIAAIAADAVITETVDEAHYAAPVAIEPVAEYEPELRELPLALAGAEIAPTTYDVVAAAAAPASPPVQEVPAPVLAPAAPVAPEVPAVPSLTPPAPPALPVAPPVAVPNAVPVSQPAAPPVAGPPAPPATPPASLGFPTSMLPAAPAPAPVTVTGAGMQPELATQMTAPAMPPAPDAVPDFEPTRGFDWGREQEEASAVKPAKQRGRRSKKARQSEVEVVPNDSFSEHADSAKASGSNQRLQWILVAGLVVVLAFLTFKIVSGKLTSEPAVTTPATTLPANLPADTVDPAATSAKTPAATPVMEKKPAAGSPATGNAKTTPAAKKDPLADAASGAAAQDGAKAADTPATGRDPFATK